MADANEAAGSLKGKVALVTGGASGLGAALCRLLGASGACVLIADRDQGRANDLAASLQREACDAESMALDVGDPAACQDVVEEALTRWGRLDILVNNAGTDVTLPLAELSPEQWQRVLSTNLNGPFYLSKYAAEAMRRGGHGHIVNITSTAAKRAWPNASAYHASKWGLLGLSHALHAELRSAGIKVTAVIAGGMRTPFLLDRFPDLDPSKLQDPMLVARAIHAVLLLPDPSVVAELTVVPLQEDSWP
jgi:NAD(P)-dependent dehydrogenase (short-subunit alcohol dehydrogenase family)